MMPRTDQALACHDPDLLWAFDGSTDGRVGSEQAVIAAVTACQGCPVALECLQHGLDTKSSGVFGGLLLEPLRYRQTGVCKRGHDITGPNGRKRSDGHKSCRICEAMKRRGA